MLPVNCSSVLGQTRLQTLYLWRESKIFVKKLKKDFTAEQRLSAAVVDNTANMMMMTFYIFTSALALPAISLIFFNRSFFKDKQDIDSLKLLPTQGEKKSYDDDKYWKSKDSPKNW